MKIKSISAFWLMLFACSFSTMAQLRNVNNTPGVYKDPIDLSARNTSISPAQNFFEYANGTCMKNTKIPADKTGWGSFFIVAENSLQQIRHILDSCSSLQNPVMGSPAQQIGDLYASAMDSITIEKAGLSPLHKSLDQISSIKDVGGLLKVISSDYVSGYGAIPPFGYYVAAQ